MFTAISHTSRRSAETFRDVRRPLPHPGGVISILERIAGSLHDLYRRERIANQTARDLQRLDERLLRDVGLDAGAPDALARSMTARRRG